MKNVVLPLFVFIILFVHVKANGQIQKGDWLVGGSAAFSSQSQSSQIGKISSVSIDASFHGGYFIISRLAVGLKPEYSLYHVKRSGTHIKTNTWYAGPFVRYYFFPNNQRANLFAQGSYAYGISSFAGNATSNSNRYTLLGGAVVFLNSAVGLEFTVGYSIKQDNTATRDKLNSLQTGIGLQFHISAENK